MSAVPTPEVLKARKPTVAQAAARYEELTRAIGPLEELRAEAKAVLVDYFEKSGRASYKERIGWTWTGGGVILDQPRAKELLAGAGLEVPTKTAKRSRSLTLLK